MRPHATTVILCVVCSLLGGYLALVLRRWRERLRARARAARGKRGERDAERVLLAHGYRIRGRQVSTTYRIEVDRSPQEVELVLDFVVESHGEQMVAEVKTGRSAPRLSRIETRRQLLEYQVATGCRRVLLVDPEAETITEVAFPLSVPLRRDASASGVLAIAAVTLLLLAAAWWRHAR